MRAQVSWLVIGALAGGLVACQRAEKEPPPMTASSGAATVSSARPGPNPEHDVPPPADVAEPPAGAETLPSGVKSILLQAGSGTERPTPTGRVKLHYSGWTQKGELLVSTLVRNRPHTLAMDRLKDGWEGPAVAAMVVGEKRRFWVPAELAKKGFSQRSGRDEPVTFEVTLVEIVESPVPPPVPPDLAAPPKDAKRTKSGLAYKVLRKGKGSAHPGPSQRVEVHYTGWTLDGKMFDSSVPRGRPSVFSLNQVIAGWTEGVQLMVEGELTRFWIPGNLAYGDTPSRPGAPAGMLVFEIELIRIP